MQNSLSLLPLSPEELDSGTLTALGSLSMEGLMHDEGMLKLGQDFDTWLDHGTRRDQLPRDLELVLSAARWSAPAGQTKGRCYGALITKITGRFTPTRRGAAMVLSNLPFMLLMASDWRASPARIALLLRRTAAGIPISWRLVETILSHHKLKSGLERDAVASLLDQDRRESDQDMGDATVATVIETLEAHANNSGLETCFTNALGSLLQPASGAPFVPYLQALLYICTIDHFFDHPPEFIYTYKPRGEIANLIFSVFPPSLAPGGNPILNNFKAVDRMGMDWAESREDTRDQARALVIIVHGLSSLAYSPRRQMSSLIRKSLTRFIQIKVPARIHLANQTDVTAVARFVNRVAAEPTNTRGVIEQRVVDFLGSLEFSPPQWRARGLGDPVHATNSSSGKLGDCDFQHISDRRCVALEAHAGRLTNVYVTEHLRTLQLNLPRRLKEWDQISGLADWTVTVRFVVHEDARSGEASPITGDIPIGVEVMSYQDYCQTVVLKSGFSPLETLELFNRWVIAPLEANNTPHATKALAAALLVDG